MGAITGTLAKTTEFAGDYKIVSVTAAVASASDTITLTLASHGISEIASIVGVAVTGGMDAAFTSIQVSYSGLVITVVSVGQGGVAATDFTGTTIAVTVLGK
jgi:hypothetical protein